jgi:hypothetical protein
MRVCFEKQFDYSFEIQNYAEAMCRNNDVYCPLTMSKVVCSIELQRVCCCCGPGMITCRYDVAMGQE